MLGKLNRYLVRVSIFVIMLALIAGIAGCVYTPPPYTPPPSQNLEIRTWYDLDAVRHNLAGNHTLMNDLNSTTPGYTELAGPTANNGTGWEPIGTFIPECPYGGFTGTFNGQGYEISDLFINRPDQDDVGLFGFVPEEGTIKNIGAVNVTVTGNDHVGGLVGDSHGTLSNSYSSGNVNGDDFVGGLVGYNYYATVSNSYSSGSITGDFEVGGLAGQNVGTMSNSYSTASVTGNDRVGGLVGVNPGLGTVSNSYSTGSVTGGDIIGGLVGSNWGTVSSSYSTGRVTGNSSVGGLVGDNIRPDYYFGIVNNSFWDTETSGQATSSGGTDENTTEMQNIATFSGAGWNIIAVALNETNPSYIWNIVNNETYPFLSWEPV
jgi:hypothetical protein